MKFKLKNDARVEGIHYLQGHIEIAPRDLVRAFGPPALSDGYKVSGEYRFVNKDGDVFTLYDWKSTSLYDDGLLFPPEDGVGVLMTPEIFWSSGQPYRFHIGAGGPSDEFEQWLVRRMPYLLMLACSQVLEKLV